MKDRSHDGTRDVQRPRAALRFIGVLVMGAIGIAIAAAAAGRGEATRAVTAQEEGAWLWLPLVWRDIAAGDLDEPTPIVQEPPTPRWPPATASPSATEPPGTASPTTPPGLPTPKVPGVPGCERVTGDAGGMRISLDGGRTFLPNAARLPNVAYTWDLDIDPRDADVILQLHQGRIYRSADAGCTWTAIGGVPAGAWTRLTRAPTDPSLWVLTSVFESRLAWTGDDGATWERETLPDDVVHFSIAAGAGGLVEPLGDAAAPAQEEPEARFRWSFAGRGALYYRDGLQRRWGVLPIRELDGQQIVAADHAQDPGLAGGSRWIVGSSTAGLWRSDDGGQSWSEASQDMFGTLEPSGEDVTGVVVHSVTIAPSDPNVVYAVANQVARSASRRAIWRSDDAGRTWTRRVTDGDPPPDGATHARRVSITGGTQVFVDPTQEDRTWFAFGTYFDGYGVDLYRSRDGLATLAVSHVDGFYELLALEPGPPGTDVLFLGASSDVPAD